MDNVQPRQHYKLYKSGKFWVTAMVSSLFLATMGAINSGAAHADDLPQDGKVSFAGPHPIQGHIQFSNGKNDPVLNIRVNDQVVFCINPFAHLRGGEYASSAQGQQDLTATYWQSLTKQQQSLINNAAYLAQAQGAAHDSETYFAGQLVVWSIISGQNGIPGVMAGSDKIDSADMHNAIGATITGWDSSVVGAGAITKAEQILNNAAAMGQRPNFSPTPLNILAGQSATVTDTNGVLQNFKNIRGTGGLSATANGNDLTVSADNSSSSGSVRMRTTSRDDSQQPYYIYGTYVGNDLSNPQQPVFAAKDPSYNEAELQVNVKKANLKIDKSILKNGGVSTKDLTNGNYSLANNVFEVHKDTADGEVVATVTTDANGNAETGSILAAGKYVVTEKQASNGLARTFNPVTVNVDSVDNLEVKASGTNAEVTGAISIQKKGAETGTQMWNDNYSLKGNIFKIHKDDLNGEVVDTITTDDNGYAKTRENLPLGRYVVEEVQASKGFQKTFAPKTVDITYEGQDKQVVLSMTEGTNQETKGRVLIDKSGATSGKNMINEHYSLEGNEFDIVDGNGKVVSHVKTDANGKAASDELPLGKYTVVETKASQGFAKTATPKEVQLQYNGQDVPAVFDTAFETNKEVKGGISIQKQGAEAGTQMWNSNYSLKDNVFKIHKDDLNGEVVAEISTDANGFAQTTKDLPLGRYVVEEVKASNGYLKTFKPQTVDINYEGDHKEIVIAATGGTNQEVKGQLIIDKSGEKSGKNMINEHYRLDGNEFDILDEQNNVVDHVETDASGKAYSKSDLKLGKYTVVETKASEGFAKTAQPQKVALTYNGEQTAVVFDTAFETNKEVTGGITIQKTGAETGTQMWNDNYSLAGNVFKIHKGDLNGEVVAEVTTDENGYAHTREDLPLGTYVVEEVQASKGFQKTFAPRTVEIKYAGQDKQVVLSMTEGTNQETKGRVLIDKSGEKSGKNMINEHYRLDGNEFDIVDSKGNVVSHVTTDASGKAVSTELPLGDYTIIETKASEGFAKTAEPKKAQLKYNGQDTPVVFDTSYEKNQEVFGGIKIHKEGAESGKTPWNANYSLKDNVFVVHKGDINGEVVAEVSTDANGYAETKMDLPLGHYVVEEKQASQGFLKTFIPQGVDITYAGQELPIVISSTGGTNQEVKGQLIIDKSGEKSGKNMINEHYRLDGNEFDILDEQNNVVDHVTTDASGKAYSKSDLKLGKYTVVETKASEGFAKTAEPQKVQLTYNGEQTAVVFDTAFETNKEVTGGITIQKTGAETGTQMWNDNYSLAGNVFKIHKGDINGEVVAEVTTDENGYAHTREDLPLGTYVVEEVQASKGFVKSFAPRTVEIKYAGQDKQVVLSMTDGTNQEVKGKIVVDKSGKESNKKLWNGNYSLAGNEFDVHENNELGKVVAHIKTDENGHAETDANLPLGKYVVVESKASKGFTKTFKPQTVELKYLGQTVALVADLARDTNQEVTGSTSVIKQDKQTGDKTQGRATFAGAEYTLYHADGTPVKWNEDGQPVPVVTVGKKVSRDNVTLRIDEDLNQAGVKHLALGDYYWQETKAPEGYQKDKEQYKFSISYQDEYTPVVTNEETSKEQVINFSFDGFKYTQSPSGKSQSGYDGIQLSLIPINGTKGEKQTVTTHTDANGYDGYYKFDNISYGDYELWEENAPEGYQHIDPLYVHIELNADKTAYVFTVTEKGQSTPLKKMTVPVSKIDEGTGNVYLSKVFLFDKSEDTKNCNGGGNNQPVINITNNNQSNASANPVVNNQSSSNSQSNPAISNNPQISNNNQQQQEEHQQQAHGDQTVTQTGASQKLDGPTTTQNGGDVHQTGGDQKTEQNQTGPTTTQNGGDVHQTGGDQKTEQNQTGPTTTQNGGDVHQTGGDQKTGQNQTGPNTTQNGGDVHQTGGSQSQTGATITNTPQITNNNNQQQQQQQQQDTAAKAVETKSEVKPADTGEQKQEQTQETTSQKQTQAQETTAPAKPVAQETKVETPQQTAPVEQPKQEQTVSTAKATEATQPTQVTTPAPAVKRATSRASMPSTGKKASNDKVTYLALAAAATGAIFITGNFDKVKKMKRKKARLALAKKAA